MHEPKTKLALNRSGYYEVRYTERVPGQNTYRTRAVSTGAQCAVAAESFRKQWLKDYREQQAPAKSSRLGDVAKVYLADVKARRQTGTQAFALAPVLAFLGEDITLDKISSSDISAYTEHRRKQNIKSGTIKRELGALRTLVNFAVRHKHLSLADKPYITLPQSEQVRELWLDEQQRDDFFQQALKLTKRYKKSIHRIAIFVGLGLYTGARKGAIKGLTWDRVDFKNGWIDYRDTERVVSNKRRVPVPMHPKLKTVLAQAFSERDPRDPYVIGRGDIKRTYERWLKSTDYPWATAHVMRHTFATLLARSGVPLEDVADLLGDDVRIVQKHYRHHVPGGLRSAIEKL